MIRPNSTFCLWKVPDDPDLSISGVSFLHKKRVGSDDPVLGRIIRTWGGGARAACDGAPGEGTMGKRAGKVEGSPGN